ncbi:MAG: sugar-binding protein [Pararhizobium sp.]
MKKLLVSVAALGVLALSSVSGSAADTKTLALVVKGLDNPYFDLMHQGCERANKELKAKGYECYYTGPATAADEGAEVQIIDDLLTKGVAAIAVSPSNAPAIGQVIRRRKPKIPIITADAHLLKKDADLRAAFVGTDNHELGVKLAQELKKRLPKGGKICLLLGNPAAANINERAAGTRDELSGKEGTEKLTGQNGWTEISGCPLYSDDDAAKSNQMMADTLTANPDLDGFVLEGGWPLFAPQAYAQVTNPIMDKIKSGKFVIISADTLAPEMQALKEHRVNALVGQRPEQMGYEAAMTMMKLAEGQKVYAVIHTGLDTCTWDNADNCLGKK